MPEQQDLHIGVAVAVDVAKYERSRHGNRCRSASLVSSPACPENISSSDI